MNWPTLVMLSSLAVVMASCDPRREDQPQDEDQAGEEFADPDKDAILAIDVPPPLQLEDPNESGVFPPRPVAYKSAAKPEFTEDPAILTDEEIQSLRDIAERTDSVRQELGERYAFIAAGRVEPDKGSQERPPASLTALTYYSYDSDRAIDVLMNGKQTSGLRPYPQGYQPPTNFEEIESARDIVLESEYAETVADLAVRGIVTESDDGHRMIYLTFRRPDQTKALQVTVDMTAMKVRQPRD